MTSTTRPMPSPHGSNIENLSIPASRVSLAQDAALHAYDVVDGLAVDGKGNEVLRRYRAEEERRRMFPGWHLMEGWLR